MARSVPCCQQPTVVSPGSGIVPLTFACWLAAHDSASISVYRMPYAKLLNVGACDRDGGRLAAASSGVPELPSFRWIRASLDICTQVSSCGDCVESACSGAAQVMRLRIAQHCIESARLLIQQIVTVTHRRTLYHAPAGLADIV